MRRFVILVIAIALAITGKVEAQSGEVALVVKGGHNSPLGAFTAVAVQTKYAAERDFALRTGVQYNTIARVTAEFRPQYFHDLSFGRVSAEILFNYTYQSHLSNYAIGCGATLDIPRLWATIGYYHRTMAMGKDALYEPFNLYYELGIRCLPKREKWDLNVIFTNSQLFELERHYQPTLAVESWWYPLENLGVQLGVNYKSAGMFHLSSDYYQIYGNVGVCYRW
jgi:hypothetical protein